MLKTLDLSLKVLELFKERNEWSLKELSEYMDENTTKIYRIVDTLEKRDFLKKDANTKRYKLGVGILELGNKVNSNFEFKEIIHPYLLYLTEKTGESSFFTILEDNQALTLDAVSGKGRIRYAVTTGSTAPLYAGASYRSILAYLPGYLIDATLSNRIEQFTKNSKTNPNLIRQDLISIRENGYAISHGELTEDVIAVAVPIFIGGKIIGSLTVSGPAYRITDKDVDSYIQILFETKKIIEMNEQLLKIV
ncbi:IclR family transcriptional regulator [Corticicoccus populi]|uniref:IclR family transcriptional regulator n=1 Tax=Corticicoccus populi TaxID=1812821 RepID=A0ABW5WX53_9STAP